MPPSTQHPVHRPPCLLLTCEHGGYEVPVAYEHLFVGAHEALVSHRGYDPGALEVALRIASRLAAPMVFSTVTRLLIDLNRSPENATLFSAYARNLTQAEREQVAATYYTPYHQSIKRSASAAIAAGQKVIHIGIHSCTDVLDGQTRDLDIALLFDETRTREKAFCEQWRSALQARSSGLRYRFNVPYRGSDDGLTTILRQQFPADAYLGLEVELRQGMLDSSEDRTRFGDLLADSIVPLLMPPTPRERNDT